MHEIGFNFMNLSFKPKRIGKIIIALIGTYLVAIMTFCLNAVSNDLHKDATPSTLIYGHDTIGPEDCGISRHDLTEMQES